MKFGPILMGVAALLAGSGAAGAATITQEFAITATDFIPYFGSTPIDPLKAVFTITYDPLLDTAPTALGITVKSANFPTLTPKFTYLAALPYFVIGTKPTLGGGALTNSNGDYFFTFNPTYAPSFTAQYIALDGSGEYYSHTGTVSISAVPEPTSWALWIAGAGLAGAALRRRPPAVRRRTPTVC